MRKARLILAIVFLTLSAAHVVQAHADGTPATEVARQHLR